MKVVWCEEANLYRRRAMGGGGCATKEVKSVCMSSLEE